MPVHAFPKLYFLGIFEDGPRLLKYLTFSAHLSVIGRRAKGIIWDVTRYTIRFDTSGSIESGGTHQ